MPLSGQQSQTVDNPFIVSSQGELAVGAATVQLTATSDRIRGIWVGAPTASHTVGATNDAIILMGTASGGNASGGIAIATDDHKGFIFPIADPSDIYFTGTAAGDVVEYMILK